MGEGGAEQHLLEPEQQSPAYAGSYFWQETLVHSSQAPDVSDACPWSPLLGSSFLHSYKIQSKVSCNGFEVMVMMAWSFFRWSLASFFLERYGHGLVILKTTVPSVFFNSKL